MFELSGFESLRAAPACRMIGPDGSPGRESGPVSKLKIPKMKSLLALAAAFAVSTFGSLHAQQQIQLKLGDVDVKQPAFDAQKTPNFQAGDVKNKDIPNPRDWLEVEVEFEVKGPKGAVVKDLLFRYYVGFRDTTGTPRVLSGDVKHINVVTGEKFFSSAYVAPNMLGEITGDFRRFQPNSVEAVGVEVYYNGVIVGGTTTKGKFWEAIAPQPGVLGKADTPFALLWIDRYAEVEKSSR